LSPQALIPPLIEEHGKVEKAYIDAAKSGQAPPGILKDEVMDSGDESHGSSPAFSFEWRVQCNVAVMAGHFLTFFRDCFLFRLCGPMISVLHAL